MKKPAAPLAGQFSLFELLVPVYKNSAAIASFEEFDSMYGNDYRPQSAEEMVQIIDTVERLVKSAYIGTDVELISVEKWYDSISQQKFADFNGDFCYEVKWQIQAKGNTEEKNIVTCYCERLSTTIADGWHVGDVFTYNVYAGSCKADNKGNLQIRDSVSLTNNLSAVVGESLRLLHDVEESRNDAPAEKKRTRKAKDTPSPIEKFIKEYNGYIIEDACTVASADFKSYCRKLRSALSKEAKLHGMEVSLKPNHYDMSGFFYMDGRYVYWSFSVQRYGLPTYLDKGGLQGFLFRTAENEKDFRGGPNHFTDLAHLCSEAYSLIK